MRISDIRDLSGGYVYIQVIEDERKSKDIDVICIRRVSDRSVKSLRLLCFKNDKPTRNFECGRMKNITFEDDEFSFDYTHKNKLKKIVEENITLKCPKNTFHRREFQEKRRDKFRQFIQTLLKFLTNENFLKRNISKITNKMKRKREKVSEEDKGFEWVKQQPSKKRRKLNQENDLNVFDYPENIEDFDDDAEVEEIKPPSLKRKKMESSSSSKKKKKKKKKKKNIIYPPVLKTYQSSRWSGPRRSARLRGVKPFFDKNYLENLDPSSDDFYSYNILGKNESFQGVKNLGNTCYISAVLNALKKLVNSFMTDMRVLNQIIEDQKRQFHNNNGNKHENNVVKKENGNGNTKVASPNGKRKRNKNRLEIPHFFSEFMKCMFWEDYEKERIENRKKKKRRKKKKKIEEEEEGEDDELDVKKEKMEDEIKEIEVDIEDEELKNDNDDNEVKKEVNEKEVKEEKEEEEENEKKTVIMIDEDEDEKKIGKGSGGSGKKKGKREKRTKEEKEAEKEERRKRVVNPRKLKKIIGEKNSIFSGSAQQDAHEFLITCFDLMKESSKRIFHRLEVLNNRHNGVVFEGILKEKMNGKNVSAVENNFKPIENNFCGRIKRKYTCLKCKKYSVVYDNFDLISVPIDEKIEASVGNVLLNYFQSYMVQKKCHFCNSNGDSACKPELVKLPKVLIIHVKRFSPRYDKVKNIYKQSKIQTKLSMRNYLDISSFCEKDLKDTEEIPLYSISSFIVHKGRSTNKGHYLLHSRQQSNGEWSVIDDDITESRVSEKRVYNDTNKRNSYLLFYETNVERGK